MDSELPPLVADAYLGAPHFACLVRTRDPHDPPSLGAREKALFATLGSEVRRSEWLAGRATSKELLRLRHGLDPQAVEILPGPDEAPRVHVSGAERPDIRFSLTHTRRYVAAACSQLPLGVDLCDLESAPRIERVERRVFAPGEAEAIGAARSPERRAMVWAVKEAALKATGGGVFVPGPATIRLRSLVPLSFEGLSCQSAAYRLPDAVLAIVVTPLKSGH